MMISDAFMDVFMPPMISADRGGGQATEKPRDGTLSANRGPPPGHLRLKDAFHAGVNLRLG